MEGHDAGFLEAGRGGVFLNINLILLFRHRNGSQVPPLILRKCMHLSVKAVELTIGSAQSGGLFAFAIPILQILTLILIMQVPKFILGRS